MSFKADLKGVPFKSWNSWQKMSFYLSNNKHSSKPWAPMMVEQSKSSDENHEGEEEARDRFSVKPTFFLFQFLLNCSIKSPGKHYRPMP